MAASGSHAESGRGGPWSGEECSSVLSSGLWSSPPSLPQWCSSKTDVSSPSVNGKSIPCQTSDGDFALDCKIEESCYLPHLPSRPPTAVPSPRAKWHQSPEQEAEGDCPKEPTPQRWREEDRWVGHLGDSHCDAFCKDSELVQWIRQTYFRTYVLTLHKEDNYELTEVFRELAEMAGLLSTEVYPVHNQWVGRKELHSAYYAVRGSAKDHHFFRMVVPLKSPKIMGLWGIHFPEALKWQVGLFFCP